MRRRKVAGVDSPHCAVKGVVVQGSSSRYRLGRALGTGVRVGRLTTFLTFLAAGGAVFTAGTLRGEVGDKVYRLGADLANLGDVLQGAHQVRVNGETVFLASAVSEEDMGTLLDRYEQNCQQKAGAMTQLDDLPSAAKHDLSQKAPAVWRNRLGIIRRQNDKEGMVVCLAHDSDQGGIRGLVARLGMFAETGDLEKLGGLRYAFARKTDNGKTHLLTTFTLGPFNLLRATGLQHRDGEENTGGFAPAPPRSKRLLDVSVDGLPYGMQAYESDESPEGLVSFYEEALPKLRWQKVMGPGEEVHHTVWGKDGVSMTFLTWKRDDDARSKVIFLQASNASPTSALGFAPR